MINRKIIIISSVIILSLLGIGVQIRKTTTKSENMKKVTSVGLSSSQQEYFSQQMDKTGREADLLEKGKLLLNEGSASEAIKYFNNLINDEEFELKGLAKAHLIDAYEKKGDYYTTYAILYTETQKSKLSLSDLFRVPVAERLKYLKYASEGEYELAVKHAQLALEASAELPLKTFKQAYRKRLNNIEASKEYIESLKK